MSAMPWWAWFVLAIVALLVVDNAIANISNALDRRRRPITCIHCGGRVYLGQDHDCPRTLLRDRTRPTP